MTTTTITLDASTLADLVKPVLPFTLKDDYTPILDCVLLETREGSITASATDRFTFGVSRQKVADIKPGLKAQVRAADLKRILSLFRASRRGNPKITLAFHFPEPVETPSFKTPAERNAWHRAQPVATLTAASKSDDGLDFQALVVTFALGIGTFPNLTKIIGGYFTREVDTEPVGFNPEYLERFKHVLLERNTPVIFHAASAGKPTFVTCGEHFIGAIMPMRKDEETTPVEQTWADFIPAK